MLKRFFDFLFSLILLIAILPIIVIVSLFIYFKLGSPIFFIQARPGLKTKTFKMIKFRTMLDSKDKNGKLLSDDLRMTRFGSFLRSTSLDELPGLINVLKGDMSLVGPRPLLLQYLPLYNKHQARRHDVRPGLTGLAQVNGRNAITWEHKFNLDVWYVDNQNLLLDFKILLVTVKKVIFRDDVNASGHVTIEPFKGSDNE